MEASESTLAVPVVRARSISRAQAWLAVGALVLVAGGFSFFFVGQSLRLDESQTLWQTSRGPVAILTTVAEDVHVPLYHEMLRVWRVEAGDSVASARLLSRILFMLSIPLMYLVGSYAYNRRVALFATLLFTLSPFMNWYADEIRMYTLFTLFAIANLYFFLRLMHGDRVKDSAVGYFLTALFGVFSHYFFFLQLFAQAVFYVMRRPLFPPGTFKRLAISWLLVGLAFLPWVAYVLYLGQISNSEPALAVPSAVDLFSSFSQFIFGFQSNGLNTVVLSLWPLLIIFAFFALRKSRAMRPETEYLLLATLVPILTAFFWSLFAVPLFVSRYLIFAVPSLYLLIASAVELYPPRAAFFTRSALVMLMLLALAVEVVSPATPVKENYEGASAYLETHAAPQDVIVLSAPFTLYPVEYYYRGAATIATLPTWDQYAHGAIPPFSASTLPAEVASTTANHQDVWLLLSYDQGHNDQIKQYFDTHYAQLTSLTFSPGLTLYEYQLRYDTPLASLSVASATSTRE